MGMFDFLKKKKLVEEKVEIGSLSYGEAGEVFEERVGVLRNKERRILSEIEGRFGDFYVSIERLLGVLEGIDIESKKEYQRAKILVRQGLDKYIGFVRGLLGDLRKLMGERGVGVRGMGVSDAGGLSEFAREVGRVFVGFEKTSAKTYERATYLVGDEMMAVRNEIRKFYNGLLKGFEKERDLVEGLRMVEDIKLKLGGIGRVEEKLKEFEREVLMNEEGVEKLKKEVGELKKEVGVIKESSEYLEGLKAKGEVGVLSKRLDGEIVRLKGFVNFKKLIGIVHSSERDMGIVKGFRDSFVSEFSRNGGKLLGILDGCGMKSSEIYEQVLVIGKLREELASKMPVLGVRGMGVSDAGGSVVGVVDMKLREIEKIEGEIELKRIAGVKVRGRLKEVGVRLEEAKNRTLVFVERLAPC